MFVCVYIVFVLSFFSDLIQVDNLPSAKFRAQIDEYTRYVAERARRGQESYLFSGSHYRGLSRYFFTPQHNPTLSRSPLPPFAHVVLKAFSDGAPTTQDFKNTHDGVESFMQQNLSVSNKSTHMVFVRGITSKDWMGTLCL